MDKKPVVGVGTVVIKDKKVLLGKRKNVHGAGLWSFPGGHLEWNEDIAACAAREVKEETGLIVADLVKIAFENDIFKKEEKHYVTLYMLANKVSGELVNAEPDKCEGWQWFPIDDLPTPLWGAVERVTREAKYKKYGLL